MAATALVHKRAALKKTILYHLAGLGAEKGMVYRAIERLNKIIDSGDDDTALAAIDKVIKLMGYAIEREGGNLAIPGSNGTGVINVQINNFDTFIKDRLSHTNLGKLLSVNDLEQSIEVIPKQIQSSP